MLGNRQGGSTPDQNGGQLQTHVMLSLPVLLMETDAKPVTAGGKFAGWVSGTPAALADGASVTGGVVFDLGPDWDQYASIMLSVQPVGATSLSAVAASGSDSAVVNLSRRLNSPASVSFNDAYATITTAGGGSSVPLRPMGRFVIVSMTNTALGGVMGDSKVTLAAYPA